MTSRRRGRTWANAAAARPPYRMMATVTRPAAIMEELTSTLLLDSERGSREAGTLAPNERTMNMPDTSMPRIVLPVREHDDSGDRVAAVTVTITLAGLARRIGQAEDKEAVAALAADLRRGPGSQAWTEALDRPLTVPLADGDPAVTLEGRAGDLAHWLGIEISSQLRTSGTREELAALIDAATAV